METEKLWARFGLRVAWLAAALGFGLLMAFPFKWVWNASIPAVFHAPEVTWGQAWCLYFLAIQTKMVILWCDHKHKS